jgi:lipoprotein-anchoring transpeptidase ErfK/SrfK
MSAFQHYVTATALAGVMSLMACGAILAGQPGAVPSPSPVTSTSASAARTTEPAARTSLAAPAPSSTLMATGHPMLRLGSHGAAVRELQKRLIALHYFDVATADGVFGPATYHSVVAFQKVQRLARDGVVGPATWAKLARPRVPVPRYRMATASLEVNLARQVLYYVRGGTIRRILDASTGRPGLPTPTGRFSIYWRYSNGWQPGPLGSMYRPNYFYRGYAVHGMTSVPAYPASHGCVRITVPSMDRMWSSLWVGMPVGIYGS